MIMFNGFKAMTEKRDDLTVSQKNRQIDLCQDRHTQSLIEFKSSFDTIIKGNNGSFSHFASEKQINLSKTKNVF